MFVFVANHQINYAEIFQNNSKISLSLYVTKVLHSEKIASFSYSLATFLTIFAVLVMHMNPSLAPRNISVFKNLRTWHNRAVLNFFNSHHFCMCVPYLDNDKYELRYCTMIIASLVVYAFLLLDM